LTSDEAIRELEEGRRTKPQRRAGRVCRVVVEAARPPPPPTLAGASEAGAGEEVGEFEVADEAAYEGRRQVAARTMPPDLGDDEILQTVVE
jgi:hypothetical protein